MTFKMLSIKLIMLMSSSFRIKTANPVVLTRELLIMTTESSNSYLNVNRKIKNHYNQRLKFHKKNLNRQLFSLEISVISHPRRDEESGWRHTDLLKLRISNKGYGSLQKGSNLARERIIKDLL